MGEIKNKAKGENINLKYFGRGLLVLFTPLVLFFGLYSLMGIGWTGNLSFGYVLINLLLIMYFVMGIYFTNKGDEGISRKKISILFSIIFMSLLLFNLYIIFSTGGEFSIPLILLMLIPFTSPLKLNEIFGWIFYRRIRK